MPFAIVVDGSADTLLVTRRHGKPITRRALLGEAVNQTIDYLASNHPNEAVALIGLSDTAKVVRSFANHSFSSLREAVSELGHEGQAANLAAGLSAVLAESESKYGLDSDATCHVLVLLAGPGTGYQDRSWRPRELSQRSVIHLNLCVLTSSRHTEAQYQPLRQFAQETASWFQEAPLPEPADSTVRTLLESFLTVHWRSSPVVISVGYLNGKAQFHPSPFMSCEEAGLPEFPTSAAVQGFLPASTLSALPSVSKHLLSEAKEDDGTIGAMVTMLMDAMTPAVHETSGVTEEPIAALLRLGPDWFAFLTIVTAGLPRPMLCCSILRPGQGIPWLGPIGLLSAQAGDSVSSPSFQVPDSTASHALSFFPSRNTIPSLDEDILSRGLTRIVGYARNLPAKAYNLLAECQKAAKISFVFHTPEVLDTVRDILTDELERFIENKSARNRKESTTILKSLLSQLLNAGPSTELSVPSID